MEVPYAEMKEDSYDPSGWLSQMDFVCDADRETCIVICTGRESIIKAATKHIPMVEYQEFKFNICMTRRDIERGLEWDRLLKSLEPKRDDKR